MTLTRAIPAALLALALLGATPARAQPTEVDPAGIFAFILENDTFSGRDRYYTNGFLFAWRSPSYNPPEWLRTVTERPGIVFPDGGTVRWGLSFGQKMFTPEDTLARNPDPTDRPYAGWLYGSASLVSYTPTQLGTLELQMGVIGPAALGGQVQNNTHDLMNIDRAYGWDSQIKDEFGVNLIAGRQWRINRPLGGGGLSWGLVPSLAGSIGNVHTYFSAGAMLRVGNQLEADFGPPRVRPASAGSVFFEPNGAWGWYAFGALEGRAVARDITLDGNTWRDSRSVDRETLVGDASIGFTIIMPVARLTATYTHRTKEFATQREAAQFGSVSVAFRF